MGFFDFLSNLTSDKKKMKYVRFETDAMLKHLSAMVDNYQAKIKLLPNLSASWPARDFERIKQDAHEYKQRILSSHENNRPLIKEAKELSAFLASEANGEHNLEQQRMERQMHTQFETITRLSTEVDHALVQQAVFLQDEGDQIFRNKIGALIALSHDEITLLEQIYDLLSTIEVGTENIREKLKHERYVEDEYEHVSSTNYPQVRDNL